MVLEDLPGGDLVVKGRLDLEGRRETVEALLVSIAAPRLREAGLRIARVLPDPEHRLYQKLAQAEPDSAHSRYNALLRRLTSFESALECVPRALGREGLAYSPWTADRRRWARREWARDPPPCRLPPSMMV